MDLFSLIIGIALGASFSPFWIKVWRAIRTKIASFNTKSEE